MFGFSPSSEFIHHYVVANQECSDLHADIVEVDFIRYIIKNEHSVLAIETALRRKVNRHLLSRKIILVSYIAECDGTHREAYGFSISTFYFWIILPLWGIRALTRLLIGRLLMIRYGI